MPIHIYLYLQYISISYINFNNTNDLATVYHSNMRIENEKLIYYTNFTSIKFALYFNLNPRDSKLKKLSQELSFWNNE